MIQQQTNEEIREDDVDIELSKLVPLYGRCKYVEGELMRALGKVYYDYYNNKMCNNTSGACNYIRSKSIWKYY